MRRKIDTSGKQPLPLLLSRGRRKLLLVSGIAVALFLMGCTHAPKKKAETAPKAAPVVVQTARIGDVTSRVSVTGSIVALQDVQLSAKQGGRLAEVTVREGDRVSTGQVLARVDAADLESTVVSDVAAVDSARAKLAQAQAAYDQQLTTTETSIASARAAYSQQVATSSAQIRSSEAALLSSRASLSEKREGDRPEERLEKRASLASAQANLKKAQADLDRYTKLHAAGAVSDADLDGYRNTRDVDQANLNSAEAAVTLQEKGSRRQDIDQAAESVRQAEETLRQSIAGRKTDAVKKADLDSAIAERAQNEVKRADVLAARASLEEAESTLRIARQAVADAVVRSPLSGHVSARSAEPGQVVTSGTTLLHVIALDSVYFEPSVPNTALDRVKLGQTVDVTLDAIPGRTFQGEVTRIYPSGSATSRSFPIRITIANAGGKLRPEMFAIGQITTESHRNAVQIPREALITDSSGKAHVFTLENSTVRKHEVSVGLPSADGDWVEAPQLQPGVRVVTTGQSDLKDGQTVTTIPDAAARSAVSTAP